MWLYVVWNIIFALDLFHDYVYQDTKEKIKHMMDGLWTYLCICVSGVPAYVMSGRELFLIACGSCASSYNGFGSLTCCQRTTPEDGQIIMTETCRVF